MTDVEKQKKAVDLAIKRMGKFIKSARLIANLGNKNNYMLTKDQQQKIIAVCNAEIANIEKSLSSGCVGGGEFNFDDDVDEDEDGDEDDGLENA